MPGPRSSFPSFVHQQTAMYIQNSMTPIGGMCISTTAFTYCGSASSYMGEYLLFGQQGTMYIQNGVTSIRRMCFSTTTLTFRLSSFFVLCRIPSSSDYSLPFCIQRGITLIRRMIVPTATFTCNYASRRMLSTCQDWSHSLTIIRFSRCCCCWRRRHLE